MYEEQRYLYVKEPIRIMFAFQLILILLMYQEQRYLDVKEQILIFVCILADPYTVSRAMFSRRKVRYPHFVCITSDPYTVIVS